MLYFYSREKIISKDWKWSRHKAERTFARVIRNRTKSPVPREVPAWVWWEKTAALLQHDKFRTFLTSLQCCLRHNRTDGENGYKRLLQTPHRRVYTSLTLSYFRVISWNASTFVIWYILSTTRFVCKSTASFDSLSTSTDAADDEISSFAVNRSSTASESSPTGSPSEFHSLDDNRFKSSSNRLSQIRNSENLPDVQTHRNFLPEQCQKHTTVIHTNTC